MRRGGLVKQTYRVVRANANPHLASQTRASGGRPPVMEQTEHQDLHVGGFLDLIEASPAQAKFADYFKQCLASNGVDFQTLDSKNYQMTVDEREFDPPAPPRPDSPAWAYLYGNMLVEFKCMADNLTPDTEYKRGLFESRIEPLKRKMKVHYHHLDWRGKFDAKMNDWKNGTLTTFKKLKAEAAAKAVASDVDGFIDLFRSNSHFQFGPDDPYHHYMPQTNEDKWLAYQKFQWDKTASNCDTAAYSAALQPLIAMLDDTLSKSQFKATLTAALKSTDATMVGQIVAAFAKASPSSCGAAGADEDAMLSAILSGLGIKGKLTKDQANSVSSMLRGSGVAGVDLADKSLAEATEILKDTAAPENLTTYYHATSISQAVSKASEGQLAVALSFGCLPELYTGLFVDPNGVANFVAANAGAADFIASLGPLNTACANLSKALSEAATASDAALKKQGVANPGVAPFLKASGFAACVDTPVTPESLFLKPKLLEMASNLSGAFMASVNCKAAAAYLESEEYTQSAVAALAAATLMPPVDGMSGPTLNALAGAATGSDFPSTMSTTVTKFLAESGKVGVPTDEMTSAVEEAFANVSASAEAVQQAQDAAAAKFMALSFETGLADVGSLEVQYQC